MKNFLRSSCFAIFILIFSDMGLSAQNFLNTASVWSIWYDATGEGFGNAGFRVKLAEPYDSAGIWIADILMSRNQNPNEWTPHFGRLLEYPGGNIYLNNSLLYDFSIIPGDTFGAIRCSTVDSVWMAGNYKKRWYFSCASQSTWPGPDTADIWIEGIGSIQHGLFYTVNCTCNGAVGCPFTNLICYHQSGNLVYANPAFSDCLQSSNVYPPEAWPAGLNNYWYYNYEEENGFGGINLGNTVVRFKKDTTVNGQACHKYQLQTINYLNQLIQQKNFFLKQNGTVLSYSFGAGFYELFNTEALPGYTWTSRNPYELYGLAVEPDSMTTYTIDSTYYTCGWFGWDPTVYRVVAISSGSGWSFQMPVMEITGGNGFFFPGKWDEWTQARITTLRCCNNKSWEPPSFVNQFPCFFLSTNSEEMQDEDLTILQSDGYLEISSADILKQASHVAIFDMTGREVISQKWDMGQKLRISIHSLPSGLYLVRVLQPGGKIYRKKIVTLD